MGCKKHQPGRPCCDPCNCLCSDTEFCAIDLTFTPPWQNGISFNRSLVPSPSPGKIQSPTFVYDDIAYCVAEWNWQSDYGTPFSHSGQFLTRVAASGCAGCPSVCSTVDYEIQHRLYCVQKYYMKTRCVSGGLMEVIRGYQYQWRFQERILATTTTRNYAVDSGGACVIVGGATTTTCDTGWMEPLYVDPADAFSNRLQLLAAGTGEVVDTIDSSGCASLLSPREINISGAIPPTYIVYWPTLITHFCGIAGVINTSLEPGAVNTCFRLPGLVTSCLLPNPGWPFTRYRNPMTIMPITKVTSELQECV